METEIVEILNVTQEAAWLPLAVQYSFFIALSCGGVLLSWPGLILGREKWTGLSGTALAAALACGLCAPLALLADLRLPGRVLNFYPHFQPSSWMSWGAFFLIFYVASLLVYAWLALRPALHRAGKGSGFYARLARALAGSGKPGGAALKGAAALCLVMALLVLLYSGAEMAALKARPLWNSYALPALLALSGVGGAAGLALLLMSLSAAPRGAAETAAPLRLMALLQAGVLLTAGLWLASGLSGLSASAAVTLRDGFAPSFLGAAAPALGLAALSMILALGLPGRVTLASLAALASAWLLRWALYMGGQAIPRTGAGYYGLSWSAGPDGLLGLLGVIGLWVFLFVVITGLVPLRSWRGGEKE